MSRVKRRLTELTFQGPRFEDHGMDIDVLPELIAYKRLLVETAKELWREQNPGRERLPRGFEDSISVKFFELSDGSTTVPLYREVEQEDDELPLDLQDELDRAVRLIEDSIEAQGEDRVLPSGLPRSVVRYFEPLGKTLKDDEAIALRSESRASQVRYNLVIRDRFIHWHRPDYEEEVEFVGEVRATDLDGLSLTLRLDGGTKVSGRFEQEWEDLVVDALKSHDERRLLVRGIGEFSGETGELIKLQKIVEIKIIKLAEQSEENRPIWQSIIALGESIPDEELKKLPSDLSRNLDKYIYGENGGGE